MKKIIFIAIITVLLSNLIAFGAHETYGEKLFNFGLIKGDSEGDLFEEESINRAEMMVILSRLYGEEDQARLFEKKSSFSDVASNKWYSPYIAYAEHRGWTNGYDDGTFGPEDSLTANMAATFLLRTLGYNNPEDFDYNQAIEFASVISIMVDNDIVNESEILRGEVFDLMYDALFTKHVEGQTLGYRLNVFNRNYVEDLRVEEIVVNNLKEVEVKFNIAVDRLTAEKTGNSTIQNHPSRSILSKDNKTLLITLDDGFEFINQESFELNINYLISNDGKYQLEDYHSVARYAFDGTVPKILGVKLTGPKKFTVTCSEPIDMESSDIAVEMNSGNFVILDMTLIRPNILEVEMAKKLPERVYNVRISGVEDYAGFKASTITYSLNYIEDFTVPTLQVAYVEDSTVKYQFSKGIHFYNNLGTEINGNDIKDFFYHTNKNIHPDRVVSYNDEVIVYYDKESFDEGFVEIGLIHDANDGYIQDAWGNRIDDDFIERKDIIIDKTSPKLISVVTQPLEQNKIRLIFSEAIQYENEYSVTIEDEAGQSIEIENTTYFRLIDENDEVCYCIEVQSKADMYGEYKVVVTGIVDQSILSNVTNYDTMEFYKEDTTPPVISDIEVEKVIMQNSVIVTIDFPESMETIGKYSVLKKDNYIIGEYELDENDFIEINSEKNRVKMTLNFKSSSEIDQTNGNLKISRLADAFGNKTRSLYYEVKMNVIEIPSIVLVETLDKSHLKITFDGILREFSKDALVIKIGQKTTEFDDIAISYNEEYTFVVGQLSVSDELKNSSDLPEAIQVIGGKIFSLRNQILPSEIFTGNNIVFKDSYRPELQANPMAFLDYRIYTDGQLLLYFGEPLEIDRDMISSDFNIELNGEILQSQEDYVVLSFDEKTLLLILKSNDLFLMKNDKIIISVSDSQYIKDKSGNSLRDFELNLNIEE